MVYHSHVPTAPLGRQISPGEFKRAPIDGFIPNHVAQLGEG
jgi:hypothetical protein